MVRLHWLSALAILCGGLSSCSLFSIGAPPCPRPPARVLPPKPFLADATPVPCGFALCFDERGKVALMERLNALMADDRELRRICR